MTEAAVLNEHQEGPGRSDGTVYDLGYTPHDGPRLGRPAAIKAIVVDGMRRALGLRRKPRAKVLSFALIGMAIIPAAFVVALTFLVEGFSLDGDGPFATPATYFDTIGTLSLLFIALVTPTLIIPDRENGVLSIYASRPVRAADYLLARSGALLLLGSLYILIPQAILYIGLSALNVDGFLSGLWKNGAEIPAIVGTTLAYVVGYGAPAFLVSLFVKRVAIASGVFVVFVFMTGALSDAIPRSSDLLVYKVLAPFAVWWNPPSVRNWLFGEDDLTPLVRAGLPDWWGLVAILAITAVTGFLALRRYRKEF